MKKLSFSLIFLWLVLALLPSAYSQSIVTNLEFSGNLSDSESGLSGPTFNRVSATTDDNGALKYGQRDQLIAPTSQEDITGAYWANTGMGNSTANNLVADATTAHHFSKADPFDEAKTYKLTFQAKAGAEDWLMITIDQAAATNPLAYLNLSTGSVGTTEGTIDASMTAAADGWYNCSILFSSVDTTDDLYIYAAEADEDYTFAGDNSSTTVSLNYLMLEKLPSKNVLGPDLMYQEIGISVVESDDSEKGKVYRIVSQSTLDFTSIGSQDNNADTVFIATSIDTLGAGDELTEINRARAGGYGFPYSVPTDVIVDGDCSTDSFYDGNPGWSYDAGNEEYDSDGTQVGNSALLQTNVLPYSPCGKGVYRVEFTIKNYVAGGLAGGAGSKTGTFETGNGTYVQYLDNGCGLSGFVAANSDFIGSVDDISVRRVTSYFRPWSSNIVALDEDDGNTAIKTTYVNHASGFYYDFNTYSDLVEAVEVGTTYKLTFSYKLSAAGSAAYRLTGFGSQIDSSYKSNTTYVEAVHVLQASSAAPRMILVGLGAGESFYISDMTFQKYPDLTYLDSSTYVNATEIPAEPVYSNDNTSLRIQGYAVNLLNYSEDFTEWTNSNTTDVIGIAGPDGGAANATTLTATDANGTLKYTIEDSILNTGDIFSIWLKRISGTGNVDITEDDGVTWETKALTSSWQRFNIEGTETDPVLGIRIVTSGDEVGIWGADLKQDTMLSAYIPTTGVRTVRTTEAADSSENGFAWDMEASFSNTLTDAGTMIIFWKAKQDYTAYQPNAYRGLVTVRDSFASIHYFSNSQGNLNATDAFNFESLLDVDWAEGDDMITVTRWDKDADGGAGYLQLVAKKNDTWDFDEGGEDQFDGAFTVQSKFRLNYDNDVPIEIDQILGYDAYLTNEQLTGAIWEASGGGFGFRSLRMSMTLK